MKKNLVYAFALVALILAACSPAAPAVEPTEAVASEDTGRCGDKEKLADELLLYNWTEYLNPDIKTKFEEECGVKVIETNYDSNETLLATLQAGGTGYDVIVPSDYMIQVMIDEGLLMELDHDLMTNLEHMADLNMNRYFDPEQKYTTPYFWGTTSFAVDTSVVGEDFERSWSLLFDADSPYCGKIVMLDDQRETLGSALYYLGYSVNDTDPAHLEEAKNLLIEQSSCVLAYDSQTNDDLLIAGEAVIAQMWTYDAILAGDPSAGGREEIEYVIAEEGATIWQDGLAVPVGAPNPYTGMVFINWLNYPDVSAENGDWIGSGNANETAKQYMDPAFVDNEGIYPPPEVAANLQWIEDVGPALELYDRVWTEFKAAIGQ